MRIVILCSVLAVAPLASPADREEDLIERVRDAGDRARMIDILELGELGTERALDTLEDLLKTERSNVAASVFSALEAFAGGELENEAAMVLAKESLGDRETRRRKAAASLAAMENGAAIRYVLDKSRDEHVAAVVVGALLDELAGEGTPEALELVLDHARLTLSAPRPTMREQLGRFGGRKNMGLFEKKLRDKRASPFFQAVIVEAVAARREPDADDVVRSAARNDSPIVVYAAADAILKRDSEEFRATLQHLKRSDRDGIRRAAFIGLGRLEPRNEDWMGEMVRSAEHRDPARRQAAAVLLATDDTPEAARALARLLEDEDHGVVREALLAIEEQRLAASVPALIDRLGRADGKLRYDIADALTGLTGLEYGITAQRWAAWWQEAGPAFEVPSAERVAELLEANDARRSAHESRAAFYGIPLTSHRVGFVIDLSGSMRRGIGGGKSRFASACEELLVVVSGLPDGALLDVMFFNSRVLRWKREPVEVTSKTRDELAAYVARLKPGGATALYDALEIAMQERELDTLYVLTDGHPDGGTTDSPHDIRAAVESWNSSRHVTIHGVSLDGENQLLRSLAESAGGRFLVAE